MIDMDDMRAAIEAAWKTGRTLAEHQLRQSEDEAAAEEQLARWKILLMRAMRGAYLSGRIDDLRRDLEAYATEERQGRRTVLRPV